MPLPRLILTSGEPAGIGPDLCIDVAQRSWPCDILVAGDADLLEERARQLHRQVRIERVPIDSAASLPSANALRVVHVPVRRPVQAGQLNAENSRYVLQLLDIAADGCLRGNFDAMVTAPVQKSIINDAGIAFSGHTEYLADRTGAALPVMMLASSSLRVVLATTHLPLTAVSAAITPALLEQVLRILDNDLRQRFHLPNPRIMVCGLNPHAGEGGHLGREEIEVISPVISTLRAQGMQLTGPVPADTAFTPHQLEKTDAVLAMYHDQGLPVLKYAGFGEAVNITLGLPIVRTSVDHGTALSLAGTGQANAGSLIAAIEMAIEMVTKRPGAN
jgi:4-hydroxythreonine-4-phosphate dehydrogenase